MKDWQKADILKKIHKCHRDSKRLNVEWLKGYYKGMETGLTVAYIKENGLSKARENRLDKGAA